MTAKSNAPAKRRQFLKNTAVGAIAPLKIWHIMQLGDTVPCAAKGHQVLDRCEEFFAC